MKKLYTFKNGPVFLAHPVFDWCPFSHTGLAGPAV